MEKPITLIVLSTDTRAEIRDTITAGDSDAYPLSITFSDLTAITGTVRFRFVRGDDYWDRDATVAANVASLMLEPAFYAATGTELWVSFEDSNLYTPLHVYFRDIRVPSGNVEAATSQTYPAWAAEVAEAEADRVTAEANRAVWETFDPDKVYAVGEKAYHLGSSYIMHTVSGVAGTLPTDTDYWAIIAQKGDAGEMTIGTVTTLAPGESATVVNSGTSTDAVLDIGIPAGYDGSAVPIDDASSAADRVLSAQYVKGQLSAIDTQLAEKVQGQSDKNIKMVGCVLRNNGTGWGFMDDAGHRPMNCTGVVETATGIEVSFNFVASKVISFVATPDETYAEQGLSFGASVGFDKATIKIGRSNISGYVYFDGTGWIVHPSSVGITSASFASGKLTVNHEPTIGFGAMPECRDGVYLASLAGVGVAYTEILFKDYSGNTIMTPNTNMKLFLSRTGVKPSPANVKDVNGNIWCMGVFEV